MYTPGPWSFGFDANGWEDGDGVVVADKRGLVCRIPANPGCLLQHSDPNVPRTNAHQEANGRLIACAPEMLDLLDAIGRCDGECSDDNLEEQVVGLKVPFDLMRKIDSFVAKIRSWAE
jgi:hypothetical protein